MNEASVWRHALAQRIAFEAVVLYNGYAGYRQ
jgi:hypothetical protein